MLDRLIALLGLSLVCFAFTACNSQNTQLRSNALTYLYPTGSTGLPASDVKLRPPMRVGVAFPPGTGDFGNIFTEADKVQLLTRLAEAFKGREGIASVQVIPSNYLSPDGSFADLDRIAGAFGIDLITLLSYDQFQFNETTRWSLTYLTVVGAYFIEGEENETRTLMDAVVFDIPSHAMLFHAMGQSSLKADATPVDLAKVLRQQREQGFALAMEQLIPNLDTAVKEFQKQVATGTVRGAGTPKIAVEEVARSDASTTGGRGAGALGLPELACAAALVGFGLAQRRERRHRTVLPRSS